MIKVLKNITIVANKEMNFYIHMAWHLQATTLNMALDMLFS